jgi:hypothetical protein
MQGSGSGSGSGGLAGGEDDLFGKVHQTAADR